MVEAPTALSLVVLLIVSSQPHLVSVSVDSSNGKVPGSRHAKLNGSSSNVSHGEWLTVEEIHVRSDITHQYCTRGPVRTFLRPICTNKMMITRTIVCKVKLKMLYVSLLDGIHTEFGRERAVSCRWLEI
jgi:hypothetical protein